MQPRRPSSVLVVTALCIGLFGAAACDDDPLDSLRDQFTSEDTDTSSPDFISFDISEPACEPLCEERTCGPDGCGGTCGTCSGQQVCSEGACVACEPVCDGRSCGSDGCGGSCGDCAAGETCTSAGQCSSCTPDCSGRACGSDGCGGSCGDCAAGESCSVGVCMTGMALQCGPVDVDEDLCVGDDDCQCVGCDALEFCTDEDDCVCSECRDEPFCNDCVDDGVCSPYNEGCNCRDCRRHPRCTGAACVPKCDGRSCGSDGCGGSCGTCAGGENCSAAGQCVGGAALMCGTAPEIASECTDQTDDCVCFGCNDDGVCSADDDCVCDDCLDDPFCGDPINCIDDGVCSPFDEGCFCTDCLAHPSCTQQPPCTPDCTGKMCGDDGCGGVCGTCPGNEACVSGMCDASDVDACVNHPCGTGADCTDLPMPAGDTPEGRTCTCTSGLVGDPETGCAEPGNALSFDGTDDVVDFGDVLDLAPDAAFTLETWVRKRDQSAGTILAKRSATQSNRGYSLEVDGAGNVRFFFGDDAGSITVAAPTSINDGQWHHVAIIYDGSQVALGMQLLVDGQALTLTAERDTLAASGGTLNDGALVFGESLAGTLDDTRLWSVARTPAQIVDASDEPLGLGETDLAAYYAYEHGVAGGSNFETLLTDDSGNGNDGSLVGFALTGMDSNWVAGTLPVSVP